jgi:hypothetical protein
MLGVDFGVYNQLPGSEAVSLSNYHRVAISLTAIKGLVYIDGGPAKSAVFSPGEISFTRYYVASATTTAFGSTRTILPAARLAQALQSLVIYDTIISEMVQGGTVDFETRFPINDPLVSQIVSTLAHEMESGFLDNILVDALNTDSRCGSCVTSSMRRRLRRRHPTGCHSNGCNACATTSRLIWMIG